mmetsp:Transcript_13349/g.37963  ORF Transcript_13349/g.37963 Transcript_13349/m.37963 type:complete len:232 (+) Transcript_13349:354-1049(+)
MMRFAKTMALRGAGSDSRRRLARSWPTRPQRSWSLFTHVSRCSTASTSPAAPLPAAGEGGPMCTAAISEGGLSQLRTVSANCGKALDTRMVCRPSAGKSLPVKISPTADSSSCWPSNWSTSSKTTVLTNASESLPSSSTSTRRPGVAQTTSNCWRSIGFVCTTGASPLVSRSVVTLARMARTISRTRMDVWTASSRVGERRSARGEACAAGPGACGRAGCGPTRRETRGSK